MRKHALKQVVFLLAILLSSTSRLIAGEQVPAGRYLVTVASAANGREIVADLTAMYGVTVIEPISNDTFVVSAPPAAARKLAADQRVSFLAQQQIAGAAATGSEAVDWAAGVSYGYDDSGNITQIGNDRYSYDVASRLIDARVNDVHRDYAYDAFGNRVDCTQDRGMPDRTKCQTFAVDVGTNRLKGPLYDTRGNMTSFAGHTYQWDAVNMMTRDNFGTAREFIYTADDERLATYEVGSTWRWTVRETSGKVLREFTSRDGSEGAGTAAWQWTNDYIYRDGTLLASQHPVLAGTETFHYHVDHLGTPRLITDNFDFVVGAHDYLPFGTELNAGDDERPTTPLKFTGHERDAWPTPGPDTLDYMHARYYLADLGRFLSLDPAPDSVLPEAPQSWNRFTYGLNNPINLSDPTGMSPCTMTLPNGAETEGECIDVEANAEDVQEVDWAQETSDFFAGFGDSLTFGGTKIVREAISQSLFNTNTVVDPCGTAYAVGEYTEIGFELAAMGASMSLRVAASQASRRAVRSAARKAMRGAAREAGEVLHHANPLFGHPGGATALFPTGGLPASIHSGSWNLQALSHAEHMAAHRYMRVLESGARLAVNPGTTAARGGRNLAGQQQCGG